MIEEIYIDKLKASQEKYADDPEAAHNAGEELMLELLREAGFGIFASAYDEAAKGWWYA